MTLLRQRQNVDLKINLFSKYIQFFTDIRIKKKDKKTINLLSIKFFLKEKIIKSYHRICNRRNSRCDSRTLGTLYKWTIHREKRPTVFERVSADFIEKVIVGGEAR